MFVRLQSDRTHRSRFGYMSLDTITSDQQEDEQGAGLICVTEFELFRTFSKTRIVEQRTNQRLTDSVMHTTCPNESFFLLRRIFHLGVVHEFRAR